MRHGSRKPWRFAVGVDDELAEAGQRQDDFTVRLKDVLLVGVRRTEQHGQPVGRSDVQLGADRADHADDFLHELHAGGGFGLEAAGTRFGQELHPPRRNRPHQGRACQISAVTKGMIGCMRMRNSRRAVHSTYWASVLRGPSSFMSGLMELQIPVAELVPEELVERLGGVVEAVGLDGRRPHPS